MNGLTALIPLDTTEFSESAMHMLPLLKEIGFEKVRLVSASDPKKRLDKDMLATYLQDMEPKVAAFGMECETRVLEGEPVDAILAEADSSDIDLIVIATHGRTGIARYFLGSVGDKLIKNSPCPRLVIGPNVEIDLESYDLTHVLVPLDGSELSELSIPIARHLAKICEAQVDLIRTVFPTPAAAGHELIAVDLLDEMLEDASSYLARMKEQFVGLKVTTNVVTGRPDFAIIEHMKNSTNDLVVIASRGRTGIARSLMGSTTERVLHGPDPVLVFEPGEDRSRLFEAARAAVD
ncbi:MAG: universal stress protein [Trueperaceae bacterium]|nr:MAG: universal stress protein [Trueperaceae bacterium]